MKINHSKDKIKVAVDESVSKHFPGKSSVASFNGAGRNLRCVATLIRPDSGSQVKGIDISDDLYVKKTIAF